MKQKIFLLMLVLCVAFAGPLARAFAEWFDGEVEKTDLQAKTVTISDVDPITETEETNEIVVSDATVFSGAQSLQDLKEGDDVAIEAQYDEPSDSWKALSVELAEAGE